MANELSCTDLNFGTIVVKAGNQDTYISMSSFDEYPNYPTDQILRASNVIFPTCTEDLNPYLVGKTVSFPVSNGEQSMTVDMEIGDSYFSAMLDIPENVSAGEYTGSTTLIITKE